MKKLLLATLAICSFSAMAEELICVFEKGDVKSSSYQDSRGPDVLKIESGYFVVEYKDANKYDVSLSVVPANANYSIGKDLNHENSAIVQNRVNNKNELVLDFKLSRKTLAIGELKFKLNNKTRRFSINWNQAADGFWLGYKLNLTGICK